MAKKVKQIVKLNLPAGGANPAPPVGTALGPTGVNMVEFCKKYNEMTRDQAGMIIPVIVTIYTDRSYSMELKTPPASVLLVKAAKIPKGSGVPNRDKVGKVTIAQVKEIAKIKMPDLNATSEAAAVKMIEGTARSMGIEIES